MNRKWIRIGTLALASALAVVGATSAFAQDGASRGEGRGAHEGRHGRFHGRMDPERRLAHLTERLHLDVHQQGLIREAFARVMQEHRAQRDANRGAARPAPEARRQAFEQIRTRMSAEIDAVLTPEQRAEFARMQAEHAARRQQHRRGDCQEGEQRDPV